MADLNITGVALQQGSSAQSILLGEAGAAFDVVYRDATDSKFKLAHAKTVETARAAYMLMTGAGPDQYALAIPLAQTPLELTLTGVAMVQAGRYVVSANSGKIAPVADLAATEFLTELWLAVSPTVARLDLNVSGIQKT